MPLVSQTSSGSVLTVRVTPRAGRTAIVGVRDNALLVKLAAAPVDGAANEALIALLAQWLDLPKRAIQILTGEKSRMKHVIVADAPAQTLEAKLAALLP